jgi:HEAT repeats
VKHNLFLALALALGASAMAVYAQQPRVAETQFNTEAVTSGLSATVTRFQLSNQALWIGYEVPALPRTNFYSCSDYSGASQAEDGCCGEYQLEATRDGVSTTDQKPSPANMYVLLRLDHGSITKIRPANAGCRLNAGGVPFNWLTGVQSNESVAFLGKIAAQAGDKQDRRVTEDALVTLAMHATSAATDTLVALAAPSNPADLREKAAFWLGAKRGHDGYVALQQLVGKEQDPKLREKLAFDLSINADPAAVDEILKMAKSDSDPQVRGQAIFWLGQSKDPRALQYLEAVIKR